MGNMSYCRFENTVPDLQDCMENIENTSRLSKSERQARRDLILMCIEIAEMYPDAGEGDFGDEEVEQLADDDDIIF